MTPAARRRAGRWTLSLVALLVVLPPSAGGEKTAPSAATIRAQVAGGRWREAIDAARAGLSEKADDADLSAALAEALFRGGRIADARRTVEPLLTGTSPPARALLVAAMARAAAGDAAAANTLFEQAAAADPDDLEVMFRAADGVTDRGRAVELLKAYLARTDLDDPDRKESARGALEFHRALGARQVWIPEARPERIELPLRLVGGRGRSLAVLIEARLCDGKPVRLLLDSGSTGLFVVARVAKRCGFEPLAVETTFGGGGDERHRTRRGILPAFATGGLKFRDALATVSDAEIDPAGRYQGIVGLQPFEGYRITLDLERGRLALDPPGSVPGTGAPYWTVSGQMLVDAESVGGAPGLFLFDTGATSSVISQSFAGASRGGSDAPPVRGFGGDVRGARTVRGVGLRFLGAELRPDSIAAVDLSLRSRMGGTEVSGFLGMDLLAGYRWIIDSVSRRVAKEAPRRRK